MKENNNVEEILELFSECIPLFTVLSDELRQNIVMILAEDEDGLNVNMITEKMPLSRPAISHHLKILKQAGIVDCEKKGTENFYFLTLKESIKKFKELISSIESNCNLK